MLCACNYIVQAHEVSFGKNIEHYSKFFELELDRTKIIATPTVSTDLCAR